ncbi:unnamed protein product [Rotaria sp. Silwood1]|nr:unnamed protein product [Rotaria sp. Silwood1]CAF4815665.1 unnamed protein product [Rotaria sp. Silwood1]CAF4865063.1 unnamed protein product [Rotaria sp. Silwood1]
MTPVDNSEKCWRYFVIIIGSIARQCYECTACSKPYQRNEEGVSKVTFGDNDYCQKTSALGIESRSSGGLDCTLTDKMKYYCKDGLCNGATTITVTIKFLAAITSLLFVAQFFQ